MRGYRRKRAKALSSCTRSSAERCRLPCSFFSRAFRSRWSPESCCEKGRAPNQIAKITIRRGAEIFALGLLFRLQEYLIAWGWAPWSDLFRVDILNTIGMSMMLMGVLCWIVLALRVASSSTQRLCGSPPAEPQWRLLCSRLPCGPPGGRTGCPGRSSRTLTAFTTWARRRPGSFRSFPGVHSPLRDWRSDFCFSRNGQNCTKARRSHGLASSGVAFILAARWLDARHSQLYSTYDYWHTSPNFFLTSSRNAVDDPIRLLRVVPLGRRTVGIQSPDSIGSDFPARVLGAHRIGLRTGFDLAEAFREHSRSQHRPADHHDDDVVLVRRPHTLKGQADRLWRLARGTAPVGVGRKSGPFRRPVAPLQESRRLIGATGPQTSIFPSRGPGK